MAGEGQLGDSLLFPGGGAVRRRYQRPWEARDAGGERLLLGGRGAAATDRHFHGMRLTLQEEGRQRMWGRPMATELGGSFCLNACFF